MTRTALEDQIESCAEELIHIPGSIQPHGFFLLTDPAEQRVTVASENADAFLGVPLKLILGAKLDTLLDREVLASIALVKETVKPGSATTYLGAFRVGKELCSVLSHCIHDRLALEFERVDRVVSPELMNAVITNFVATLGRVPSQRELCQAVTRQVAELTGYDRVLLYSFDEEGHGTVLAEANNGKLPSYLDLRFPASDIPQQARELYLRNTMRIIPDANYAPAALRGLAGEKASLVDLSQSVLRSVSPVHIEYLRNMGTMSSMSISIVIEGKLWGLISGHHAEPKTVPYLIRSACDMLAKMTGTQLMALRTSERLAQTLQFHAVQRQVLTRLASEPNYLQGLREQLAELAGITNAQGVALLMDGEVDRFGTTPDTDDIRKLGAWLDEQRELDVFATHELGKQVSWAQFLRTTASGLLAVKISSVRQRYLLWFRPEVVETVQWAGEPIKKVEGQQLHPRQSFEAWKEVVHGRSEPWSELEMDSAVSFRSALTIIGLRRAEEAIELGEARFQQLTSALPAKVFMAGDDGRLTYVNQRWNAQGLSRTGRWFDDAMLSPEDAARCAELWKSAVAQNTPLETEVRLREQQGGPERWNFVRVVPFLRAGAARAGWIGTIIDLTDAKEREMALRVNEKLALSGRMTSVIAHEINNPLAAITNLMYLMRMEVPKDGPAVGYIGLVESELERISGITKQTLRWNRENSDREETFRAQALVDDVMRLFAGKIRNRQVTVDVRGERDLELHGVIGQLRQVLANLLANAIDAAPLDGHVVVELLQRDGRVGFAVHDDGPGIPDAVRERLFEPFYSTKGDLGNGLGLYITKEIVERHKGSIGVESRAGGGTTMMVLLPRR